MIELSKKTLTENFLAQSRKIDHIKFLNPLAKLT